jgi:hypothetical protein
MRNIRFEIDYTMEGNQRFPFIWDYSTDTEEGCYISKLTMNMLYEQLEDFQGVSDFTYLNRNQSLLESLYNMGNIEYLEA